MINALLIVVHLFVSGTLVLFVLLHAGRGGGLSDMFGGAAGGSSAGSGAALAANFTVLAVGTDTSTSVRGPSTVST